MIKLAETGRRGFLASVAALSMIPSVPCKKSTPIKWKKTKWQMRCVRVPGCAIPVDVAGTETREWKAEVEIPTLLAVETLCNHAMAVNSDKYRGAEPRHLQLWMTYITRTSSNRCKAKLLLIEKKHDQSTVSAHDPEGGLFGTPVVHEFEVYEAISFIDLFQKVEEA